MFLTSSGHVKLGDLNVSKVNKAGMLHTQTGTPCYASPEIWNDKPYTFSSDIWSLGCLIYELAALCPPFEARDMRNLYRKVTRGTFTDIPDCYSGDLKNLLKVMLHSNPVFRPTCKGILQMPCVKKNMGYSHMEPQGTNELLQTINYAKNRHFNRDLLPKASYGRRGSPGSSQNKENEAFHKRSRSVGKEKSVSERKELVQLKRPPMKEFHLRNRIF